MNKVFAGCNSLTTLVITIDSIDGGVLLAEAVTVWMLSAVRVRVRASGTGAAEDVAAEPPSTATTEYGTLLRAAGCLGDAWGFSGRAWDIRSTKQSTDMNRRNVRRMIDAITKCSIGKYRKEQRVEALEDRDTFPTERYCAVCNVNVFLGEGERQRT